MGMCRAKTLGKHASVVLNPGSVIVIIKCGLKVIRTVC